MKLLIYLLLLVLYVLCGSTLESMGFEDPAVFSFYGFVYAIFCAYVWRYLNRDNP